MRSSTTEDHPTHEAVPGNESNYGETSAGISTGIYDQTRVIGVGHAELGSKGQCD